MNNRGQVVGIADTAHDETHAFLWDDGVMTDLGTLGGTYSRAAAMNDSAQIVGEAALATGEVHAALWQPRECH